MPYNIQRARNTNLTNAAMGHKEPFVLGLFWKEPGFKIILDCPLTVRTMRKGLAQVTAGPCPSLPIQFGANLSPGQQAESSSFACGDLYVAVEKQNLTLRLY